MATDPTTRLAGDAVDADVAVDVTKARNLKPELLDAYKRMLTYQFSGALVLVAILALGLLTSYLSPRTGSRRC